MDTRSNFHLVAENPKEPYCTCGYDVKSVGEHARNCPLGGFMDQNQNQKFGKLDWLCPICEDVWCGHRSILAAKDAEITQLQTRIESLNGQTDSALHQVNKLEIEKANCAEKFQDAERYRKLKDRFTHRNNWAAWILKYDRETQTCGVIPDAGFESTLDEAIDALPEVQSANQIAEKDRGIAKLKADLAAMTETVSQNHKDAERYRKLKAYADHSHNQAFLGWSIDFPYADNSIKFDDAIDALPEVQS